MLEARWQEGVLQGVRGDARREKYRDEAKEEQTSLQENEGRQTDQQWAAVAMVARLGRLLIGRETRRFFNFRKHARPTYTRVHSTRACDCMHSQSSQPMCCSEAVVALTRRATCGSESTAKAVVALTRRATCGSEGTAEKVACGRASNSLELEAQPCLSTIA